MNRSTVNPLETRATAYKLNPGKPADLTKIVFLSKWLFSRLNIETI
jgi:hypothetical protein